MKKAIKIKLGLKLGSKGKSVIQLQRFLERLGLLKIVTSKETDELHPLELLETNIGKFDKITEQALIAYQNFNAIEPSGVWDKNTNSVNEDLNCGVPDVYKLVDSVDLEPQINLLNEDSFVTYRYAVIGAPRILSVNKVDIQDEGRRHAFSELAADRAVSIWAMATNLRFVRSSVEDADITIRFKEGLASVGNALIELNDSEDWSIGPSNRSSYDLVYVIAHEVGHKIGLNHRANSIMNTTLGKNKQVHKATAEDQAQLREKNFDPQKILQMIGVHGTGVHAQFPESLDLEKVEGSFTKVISKSRHSNIFHFALTTPIYEFHVHSVLLRFRTFSNLQIEHIDIYDGERRLSRQLLFLSKSSINIWNLRISPPAKQKIINGLGVSIKIKFTGTGNSTNKDRLDLFSAGAFLCKFPRSGQLVNANF